MNGHGGGAIEALGGAAGGLGAGARPSATLQALAEALGALGAANAAAAESAAPAVDAAQVEAPTLAEALLPGSSALAAQSAQQGQMTLGQLAAEQAQRRAANGETLNAGASTSSFNPAPAVVRHDVAPDGVNTPRLPDLLAVPVTVTALHTPFINAPRAQKPEQAPPQRVSREDPQQRQGDGGFDDEPGSPALDLQTLPREESGAAEEAAPDPDAARLRAALEREGRADALLELDRGRRLLLVLPQAGGGPAAVAWLLGPQRAQRHAARWWPGPAGHEGWLPWRVFRDGDPQLGRGLVSRAGGHACRVRLGPQPPRLPDAAAASLEIAERIRFAQALGGQWSLLLLAAPAGWNPS